MVMDGISCNLNNSLNSLPSWNGTASIPKIHFRLYTISIMLIEALYPRGGAGTLEEVYL